MNLLQLQGLNLPGVYQAIDSQKANALQMKRAQREDENQQIISQYAGPAIAGDQAAFGKVAGANPQLAVSIRSQSEAARRSQLERIKTEAPLIGQALKNVQDQAGYDQARTFLQDNGVDVAKMPPQYSPDVVTKFRTMAQAWTQKEAQPTNLSRLIAERDSLPQNDPRRQTYDSAIAKESTREGQDRGGPFAGNAIEAQALNIVASYQQKKAANQPTTPQDDYIYSLAVRQIEQPKVVGTPESGFTQITPPPLPQYPGARPPAAAPAPQPVQAAPQPAPGPGSPPPAVPATATTSGVQPLTTPRKTETFNEVQGKSAGFADRMANSNSILNKVGNQGASYWGRLAEKVPGGNYMQSDEYQQFEQARRDFVNAQLRRESGAVISPEEFANADKQYFPQPGDSEAVIRQKAANRRIALESMARDAGPAYKQPQQAAAPQQNIDGLKSKYGITPTR